MSNVINLIQWTIQETIAFIDWLKIFHTNVSYHFTIKLDIVKVNHSMNLNLLKNGKGGLRNETFLDIIVILQLDNVGLGKLLNKEFLSL